MRTVACLFLACCRPNAARPDELGEKEEEEEKTASARESTCAISVRHSSSDSSDGASSTLLKSSGEDGVPSLTSNVAAPSCAGSCFLAFSGPSCVIVTAGAGEAADAILARVPRRYRTAHEGHGAIWDWWHSDGSDGVWRRCLVGKTRAQILPMQYGQRVHVR